MKNFGFKLRMRSVHDFLIWHFSQNFGYFLVIAYQTNVDVCPMRINDAHKAKIIRPVEVWPTLACSTSKQGSNNKIERPRARVQLGLIHSS